MDGLNFFLGGQLFTVFECPPEYDCDTRPLPWNLRITCCGQTIVGNVPGGASLAQINTVWQAMLAYCASLSCGGGPGPSPSSNGWQISLRVCNTTLIGNVPPGATPAQINNIWLSLQHQYALLLPTCNGVTPSNPVPPPSKPQFIFQGSFPTALCINTPMPSDTVSVITGFSSVVFIVSSGTIPPGTVLVQIGPKSAAIQGSPTTPGTYTFTIQVSNGTWSSQKSYTIGIIDITNGTFDINTGKITLLEGKVDEAYSLQLLASGGTGPYTWTNDPILSPSWLTMSSGGLITGTPDTIADWEFDVTVTDSNGRSCSMTVIIPITGPKITLPAAGTVCTAYVGDVTLSPPGSTIVSYSMPVGLTMTVGGHITGTPLNTGNLTVTATDGFGNFNTKTLIPFITLPVGQAAASAEDLVWTTSEIVNPPAHSTTISGLAGNHLIITAWGGCQSGSIYTAYRYIDTNLRNCSPNAYLVTISIDYNVPTVGLPCGANAHAWGDIDIDFNGEFPHVVSTLLTGVGTVSQSWTIAAGSTKHIRIGCDCRGDDTSVFHVNITPDTPP